MDLQRIVQRLSAWGRRRDDRPFHELVNLVFPDRYPYPLKCLLGVLFLEATRVPMDTFDALAARMGYVKVTDWGDIGGGAVLIRETYIAEDIGGDEGE